MRVAQALTSFYDMPLGAALTRCLSVDPGRRALEWSRPALKSPRFANYVPAERRNPNVLLLPEGDADYFPPGVKHRYTRGE